MAVVSLLPDQASQALLAPLAIVVPIYNEMATIEKVVADWQTMLSKVGAQYQFLLINDGSTDQTWEVLRQLESSNPRQLIIINKSNAGHGRSCRLGYDAAVAAPGVEWVLQIDSDGQCDPSYFKTFWDKRGQADCIFGQRVLRDDGLARAITSTCCRIGSTFLGGKEMVDPNVPYRLIRRQVLAEALRKIPASFDIHNVALTFVLKQTADLQWVYIPIRFLSRQGGQNSINLLHVIHLGFSMLFDLARLKERLRKPRAV